MKNYGRRWRRNNELFRRGTKTESHEVQNLYDRVVNNIKCHKCLIT